MPNPSVFDEYDKGLKCRDWPGPGVSGDHHVYFVQPMKEFIEHNSDHVDSTFQDFKVPHSFVAMHNLFFK